MSRSDGREFGDEDERALPDWTPTGVDPALARAWDEVAPTLGEAPPSE